MAVNAELLEILVCPETKQPLRVADATVIADLNEKVAAGTLRNRGGDKVAKAITEGLIREDGRALYIVDDDIPVMLVEESIEL